MREFQSRVPENPERSQKDSFEILSPPEMRRELLQRTDEIIDLVRERQVNVLIFLDKSARPLSWLFRERFKHSFPKEKVPEVKFVNIGSEKTPVKKMKSKPYNDENIDLTVPFSGHRSQTDHAQDFTPPEKQVDELRNIYGKELDGKDILIVDEIALTGGSMKLATALFEKAFPNVERIEAVAYYTQDNIPFDNKDLMPWFKNPGLIGVFDLLSDNQLLTNRIDKTKLEFVRAYAQEQRDSTLYNVRAYIHGNERRIAEMFASLRTLGSLGLGADRTLRSMFDQGQITSVDLNSVEDFDRRLDWLRKAINVLMDEQAGDRERANWETNIIGDAAGAEKDIRILRKTNPRLRRIGALDTYAEIYREVAKKAAEALKAVKRMDVINNIDENFRRSTQLRAEMKSLAMETIEDEPDVDDLPGPIANT